MAMLAEPRRRQRIGPNPRGKFFCEDEDNRGRALLQKLGWKNGDGLGVQKNGITAPIQPKIQMNSNGLGYDIKSDPWMEHSKEFAEVLENLQILHGVSPKDPKDPTEEVRMKLEIKSKHSRTRIHYHKFAKGKDLSSISSDDWTCIFGNSVPSSPADSGHNSPASRAKEDTSLDTSSNVKTEVVEETERPEESNTINRGSMQDYFKIKMAKKRSLLVPTEPAHSPKRIKGEPSELQIVTEKTEEPEKVEEFNTINRGSMDDYFKAKMAEKKSLLVSAEPPPHPPKPVKEESPEEMLSICGDSGDKSDNIEIKVSEKSKHPRSSRFLPAEEVRALTKKFKGSNLFSIRGYGMH